MTKGERTTTYFPTLPPEQTPLAMWMYSELQRIAAWMDSPIVNQMRFAERHVEPDKPRDGDVAYADGTDWSPGAEGLYQRKGGSWSAL